MRFCAFSSSFCCKRSFFAALALSSSSVRSFLLPVGLFRPERRLSGRISSTCEISLEKNQKKLLTNGNYLPFYECTKLASSLSSDCDPFCAAVCEKADGDLHRVDSGSPLGRHGCPRLSPSCNIPKISGNPGKIISVTTGIMHRNMSRKPISERWKKTNFRNFLQNQIPDSLIFDW
jgi:hypothetical protein